MTTHRIKLINVVNKEHIANLDVSAVPRHMELINYDDHMYEIHQIIHNMNTTVPKGYYNTSSISILVKRVL